MPICEARSFMFTLLRCLAAAAAFAPAAAFAHVTFESQQARPNSTYKAVLRIPHGCGEQPHLCESYLLLHWFLLLSPWECRYWNAILVT